jgi:hypothetical protein
MEGGVKLVPCLGLGGVFFPIDIKLTPMFHLLADLLREGNSRSVGGYAEWQSQKHDI